MRIVLRFVPVSPALWTESGPSLIRCAQPKVHIVSFHPPFNALNTYTIAKDCLLERYMVPRAMMAVKRIAHCLSCIPSLLASPMRRIKERPEMKLSTFADTSPDIFDSGRQLMLAAYFDCASEAIMVRSIQFRYSFPRCTPRWGLPTRTAEHQPKRCRE